MNIIDNFKKIFFYRQHPETALRYLPIVKMIKEKKWEKQKILEIGSGSYGIAPYLKEEIVGVDTDFSEPEYPLLKQVKTSGKKLPFKDSSFDLVILSDVLEHIPKSVRRQVLEEAVRVGKKAVFISGPFGEDSSKQDKKLANYSLKRTGGMHPYFKEHLELGLPEVEDIFKYLEANSKVKEIKIMGDYLNLSIREWMMKLFISNSKLSYYFYLKGLMFFIPILIKINNKPCYRTLLFVELK
jgi:ubiquinone/menaquinone biosynthesis C-methylase UbiE